MESDSFLRRNFSISKAVVSVPQLSQCLNTGAAGCMQMRHLREASASEEKDPKALSILHKAKKKKLTIRTGRGRSHKDSTLKGIMS